jgi:hypothetical protein
MQIQYAFILESNEVTKINSMHDSKGSLNNFDNLKFNLEKNMVFF